MRIYPCVCSQVLVLKLDAGVQYCGDNGVAALSDVPCLGRDDARSLLIRTTESAPSTEQPPHLAKERIVWNCVHRIDKIVGLGVFNARIFLRAAHGFFYRQTAVEMNQLNAVLCSTRQRFGSCPLHANYLPG